MQYGVPFQIEAKQLDGTEWSVEGYASTFGNTDLGGDIVQKGAFAEHLASGRKTRFLYSHDPAQVLGTATGLSEDDSGLYGRFKISKTPLGEQVRTLLKDGALDSFSIGYVARDYDLDRKAGTRTLKDVELVEVSVVAMPMNPAAVVTGIKSFALMGFEDIRAVLQRQRAEALEQARAYFERRAAEGREPKDRVLEALAEWQRDAAAEAARLVALLTEHPQAPEPAEPEPEQKAAEQEPEPVAAGAAGLVESYLRRRAIADRLRKYD